MPTPAHQVPPGRRTTLRARLGAQVLALRDGDSATLERMLSELSRRHRALVPLGLAVGTLVLLVDALRLLAVNWRLLLVEILPAIWIWLAMLDLKAHVWYDRSFTPVSMAVLVPAGVLVVLITTVGLALNAVFAFAIAGPGPPRIRPSFSAVRARIRPVVAWGLSVGVALGVAALVAPRAGRFWFAVSMSVAVAALMLTYVAVPARLAGIRPRTSRRDAMGATVVAGTLGMIACAPGYLLGRLGVVMLDSHRLIVVGGVLLAAGFVLEAGATGAVRAVKISAKVLTGRPGPGGSGRDTPG